MAALYRLSSWIVLATGWPIRLFTFVLGLASALAFAPFHFFPVLFLTLPAFILVLDGALAETGERGWRRLLPAFARGWWFGFGYFAGGLWWLGSAFLVEAEDFAWALPLAVTAFPAFLGLFFGFAAAIARFFWSEDWRRVLALSFGIGLMEWLRGVIFTGFPWNSFGHSLAANDILMQALSIVGADIYTLLAVLIFASPVLLLQQVSVRGDRLVGVLFASPLVLIAAFGVVRMSAIEPSVVDGTSLRIIQPAIDQRDKWRPEMAEEIIDRYIEMSRRSTSPENFGLAQTTHLIWPESAFPFLLTERPDVLARIADLLPPGTTLLTGAARAGETLPGASERTIYNSLFVINSDGEIVDAYDKVHLVPFGEYLPFQPVLESVGMQQLTRVVGGFSAGSQRTGMATPTAPAFLPLICYEIIFSNEIRDSINKSGERESASSPEWFLNLTNDAWFGVTSGPYQHLHQARLRAVEFGIPVVRAANTGISAIISPLGQVLAYGKLGQIELIDHALPQALDTTIFRQLGHWFLTGFMFIVFLVLAAGRLRHQGTAL